MRTIKKIIKFILIALIALFLIYTIGSTAEASTASARFIDLTEYIEFNTQQITDTAYNENTGKYEYLQSAKYYKKINFENDMFEYLQNGYFFIIYGSWANRSDIDLTKDYEIHNPVLGNALVLLTNKIVTIPSNFSLPEVDFNVYKTVAYESKDNGRLNVCYSVQDIGSALDNLDKSQIKVYFFTGDIYSEDPTEPWYITKAIKANNPVLYDESYYYEGVSQKSHLVSDLTYLEIPFKKYYDGNPKNAEVIAFAEALFVDKNNQINNNLVMYIYDPEADYSTSMSQYYYFNFSLEKYYQLVNNEYIDKTSLYNKYLGLINAFGEEKWKVIEYDSHMLKLVYASSNSSKFALKELALKDYSGIDTSAISNKVQFKVDSIKRSNSSNLMNGVQNIQWMWSKELPEIATLSTKSTTEAQHTTSCVIYLDKTVKVDCEVQSYHFDTPDDIELSSRLFGFTTINWEFIDRGIDVFAAYFNVFNEDDEKWTESKDIYKVTINYVDYMIENTNKTNMSINIPGDTNVYYYNSDGSVYAKDTFAYGKEIIRDMSTLKSIYQKQVVEAEDISLNFPADNNVKTWGDWLINSWNGYQLNVGRNEAPAIWKVSESNFNEALTYSSDYDPNEFSDYTFAMFFGSLNGYSCVEKGKDLITPFHSEYHYLTIPEFLEIEYRENGVAYHVYVSETNCKVNEDKLDGNKLPGDPIQPTKPIKEQAKDFVKELFDRIGNFFNKIPEFFKSLGAAFPIILITAGIVVAGLVTYKIVYVVKRNKAIDKINKKE